MSASGPRSLAFATILSVLRQFASYGLGAGLGDAGLGNLNLGVGQVEQRT